MKKIVIYLTTVILLFAGCKKDPLDITPDGRLTLDDVFKDEKLTEAYLNTVYSSIPDYAWRYHFWDFLATVTDEAQTVHDIGGTMAALWYAGSLTTSFNPLAIAESNGFGVDHYKVFWAGIRDANIFIGRIDNANVPSAVNKNRFRAEAKVLRAFYYLELIKEFGPMPIVDKPFESSFDYSTIKRPSYQECVDFIVKNCDEAIATNELPLRIVVPLERGRFTKAVAHSIKSQALLFNASPLWNPANASEKWRAAADAARKALDDLTAGNNYQLAQNYGDYFTTSSDISNSPKDKETIFEVPKNGDGALSVISNIPSKPGTVKAGTCPTQELVDSYDMQATGEPAILGYNDADHLQPIINAASGYKENDPYTGRDPRFYATIWYNGAQYDNIGGQIHTIETFVGGADQLIETSGVVSNTRTGYYLRKFIDPRLQAWQAEDTRWKKFRLAELYLNFAEAENEVNGPTSDVHNAVNEVRRRSNMPILPLSLDKDGMRERIRRERRVEFAIEDNRFWDVRRWKILDKTDKLVTGIRITKTNNTFSYQRFVIGNRRNSWQDKYRILPIPITETSIIPDFNLNQNPGW